MILYNPNYYPTSTGDGEILFQYKEINDIDVEITFDPPYSTDLMSDEAKLELGFM